MNNLKCSECGAKLELSKLIAATSRLGSVPATPDRGITTARIPSKFRPQINLLRGDAFDRTKRLPSNVFDLCSTSPPYFNLVKFKVRNDYGAINKLNIYIPKLVALLAEVRRTLKHNGVCCVEIGEKYDAGSRRLVPQRLAVALQDDGWLIRQEIIAHTGNPFPSRFKTNRPMLAHRHVFILAKHAGHYYQKIKENHLSVWEINSANGLNGTGRHPAPMQQQLAERLIASFSPQHGHVFDPFVGSGQTAVAAVEQRCHITGIDASQRWIDHARKRLTQSC